MGDSDLRPGTAGGVEGGRSPICARLCVAGLHAVENAFGTEAAQACRAEVVARAHACSQNVLIEPAEDVCFVLQFSGIGPSETYERCEALRRSICDKPFSYGSQRFLLSAALSIGTSPEQRRLDGLEASGLIFFDGPPLGDHSFNSVLAHIVANEVVLFYQPFRQLATTIDTEALLSGELLSRLRRHGKVSSFAAFLSIAERHGFIAALDCALIEKAIAGIARMRDARAKKRISINVSAVSLDAADCGSRILSTLRSHGVEPSRIALEITEGTRAEYPMRAANTIERLRGAGVLVGLDDFGTGYNELKLLRNLPVDYVKISGEFLPHHQASRRDWLIIDAIVALAHKLGALTVAEGVETVQTLDALQQHGLDYAQGYLVGRPRPALPPV